MRDRRHVADAGNDETDRLQRAQRRLAARTRTLHLDLEGAHAMLGGPLAGRVGSDLRGIRRRLARALEALAARRRPGNGVRSEEHTSELQSLMRISYAVFCLKKKQSHNSTHYDIRK